MFSGDNYLDEPQDIEFNREIINIIKGSKQLKDNMNKNLCKFKEGGDQPSEVQANNNRSLPDATLSVPYSSSRTSQGSAKTG